MIYWLVWVFLLWVATYWTMQAVIRYNRRMNESVIIYYYHSPTGLTVGPLEQKSFANKLPEGAYYEEVLTTRRLLRNNGVRWYGIVPAATPTRDPYRG